MAKRYYTLHAAGCTRELPILNISDTTAIAAFVILGDVEMTERAAEALAKIVPPADVLMTAETKGIPLAHALARLLGEKRFVVARKSVKGYMEHPLIERDRSITTAGEQILVLQDEDAALLRGKRVLLVDDVISTGGSMRAMEALARRAGADVCGRAAILAEGDAALRKDILYLERLPLFPAE